MKYNLGFIEYDELYVLCEEIINQFINANKNIDRKLHSNIVDPFSAVFESLFYKITLSEWVVREKNRQIQKTCQNQIGLFHQRILGNLRGWENLNTENVIDLINREKKIIAEIKNKFNTTKGNHKIAIYDDLSSLLKEKYQGYTAYYVAILAKNRFNKPFVPSDNKSKSRRQVNESILEVDGKTFYEIATNDSEAIYKIYKIIPYILSDILKNDSYKVNFEPLFEELFKKAFNQ